MARRKKEGLFEDLVAVAALMPWWLGLAFALISYLVIHQFAGPVTNPTPANVGQLGGIAGNALISSICSLLQYVVPVAFVFGAAISAWRVQKPKDLLNTARSAPGADKLNQFTWREFESIVGESFRQKGYVVRESGGKGPDGGIDLTLHMGDDKYLVQCKHWKSTVVGVVTVRELFGVMSAEGAVGGFVVASGAFTAEAKKFAEGRSIELVNALTLVNNLPPKRDVPMAYAGAAIRCRSCGSSMVQRKAKVGPNAGSIFWGCTSYPRCKEIKQI